LNEIFVQSIRDFQDSFCKHMERSSDEKPICYNSLSFLDEALSVADEQRRKRLDDFAFHIVTYVQNRLRFLLREIHGKIGDTDLSEKERLTEFHRRIIRYEECFETVLSDLERFNSHHPLKPLSERTIGEGRKGFAHFKMLSRTCFELFEIEIDEGSLERLDERNHPENTVRRSQRQFFEEDFKDGF